MQPTSPPQTYTGTALWALGQRPALPSLGLIMRRMLGIAVAGFLLALSAALGLIIVGSAEQGWPVLLRELLHLLLAPVFPALLVAAMLRARRCALALLPPLLLTLWLPGPQLAPRPPVLLGATGFRALVLNTGAAQGHNDPLGVARLAVSTDADVICLLEARPDTLTTIGRTLLQQYPFQTGAGEIYVLSRFPLSEARTLGKLHGMKDSLEATVEVDRRLIDVTVVHLQRPDASLGFRSGIGPLIRSGGHFSTAARDDAVNWLHQRTRQRGGAQLVVGDFNMTPTSAAYQTLTTDLQDAFRAGGWGLGHTYPISRRVLGLDVAAPLLRIDYLFHSADLQTIRAWVPAESPSDHAPVIADLAFR